MFVCCKDTIPCKEVHINNECEAVVCQISLNSNKNLIVFSFYRPPGHDIQYATNLCNLFRDICTAYSSSLICLAGDLNLPGVDWKYCNLLPCNLHSSLCNIFIDFILEYGFTQIVDFPTREHNILDIFLTNHLSYEYVCKPLTGISDHGIVYVTSAVDIELQKPISCRIYLWHKANFEHIKSLANSLVDEFLTKHDDDTPTETLWQAFKSICSSCLNCVPSRITSQCSHQPWINTQIKRLSNKKQRLYNKAKRTMNIEDLEVYKCFKKFVQKECRIAYSSYIADSLNASSQNGSKCLWSYIKSRKKDNIGVGSLRCDGLIYTDSLDKANVLNQHFSSVFTTEDTSYLSSLNEYNIPAIESITINPAGVADLLSNIKPFKPSGPDDIPTFLLKEIAIQNAPSLAVVFQASLNQCKLPADWKIAHVVPVFKKGDKSSPNNYRPISLTCLCCKTFENIVYSNIFTHLNQANILCEEQHGFRERRCCESQLIVTIDDFAQCY